MIPEIGLMLGLYILTRLTTPTEASGWRRRLHIGLAATTALVTTATVVDLVVRGTTGPPLWRIGTDRAGSGISAQGPDSLGPALEVSKTAGGGFVVNYQYTGLQKVAETSLKRERLVFGDPTLPVELSKDAGVAVAYKMGGYSGDYRWSTAYALHCKVSVTAVDVRFLLFDVWGNHIRTLQDENVADVPAGGSKQMKAEWNLYPENDAVRYFASIAYVARVRLQDGRIVEANEGAVLREVRKYSRKFEPEALKPPNAGLAGTSGPSSGRG